MSVESIDSIRSGAPIRPPGMIWRLSYPMAALAVGVACLSVLPFWDGLVDMWIAWTTFPEYSHCLLIPPIAAFLVWQQKDRLERVAFDGSWAGVALVVCGGALLVIGQLGTIFVIVQYAYYLTLLGLALAFTGRRAFRLIAAPMLILFFMIPLPTFAFQSLSAELQLISSQLGVYLIRACGISVFLEGNVIDLGGYKLQVAEACSGLRYLFPLLTLGFLMAYFYKGALWKRVVLFLSSMPVAVLMNSFRIGTVGVMVDHWGIGMAEGFLHEFQGWMVFMASAALMLAEIAVLNRIGRERGTWAQLFGVEFPAPSPAGLPRVRRTIPAAFWVACALLVGMAAVSAILPRPAEIIPTRTAFADFPMQLGPWAGRRESLDGVYLDALQLDDYLLADYGDERGGSVDLYAAYYKSQRHGEAVHSPRSCLPGGGWQFRSFDQRTLGNIKINGRPLRVNRALIQLGDQRQLVYYWFEQRGRVITNEFVVKWYLFLDALTRHRTDGALVRLITPLPPVSEEADADRRLTDVAARIAPLLPRYVPN